MRRNMKNWLSEVLAAKRKRAMPILSFPAVQLMHITVRDLIADPAAQARGMKLVAERVPSIASVSMMDLSVEAEGFGAAVRVSDNEVPTVVGRIVTDEEGARALRVPEVAAGRTGLYVRAIEQAAQWIEDRPVLAGCIGPFSLAGRLMDVSEIMINCYDAPEMVHMTMEKTTEFIIRYLSEYKRVGANGVVMAEPLTGMLSPALEAEFSTPYVRRIRQALADDHFLFVYHNCGNNVPLMLDSLLTIGADAYHFGNAIDLKRVLDAVPASVPILGNLDPAGVLRGGTPALVYERTMEMLERLGDHPNYIPSSGCDIPPTTPWENIDAFFRAVEDSRAR